MPRWLDDLREGRRFAALLLCFGLVHVACYYLAAALVNGSGPLAIPQPDTPLYFQAAARVAEGHPFSYSAGSALCTGTTSVLYPFVLAIPYLLGAKGDSLCAAGFVLNAVFYLIFLLGWGVFIWRRFADHATRVVAGTMLAIFPQCAYCALAQSDIGLWLAWSGLLAAGLAAGRFPFYAAVLVLAPWIRPEGMVCAFAFALVWACDPGRERRDLVVAVLALASVAGVFALNIALTGHAQFSSVANKGHFSTLPFAVAIMTTADTLVDMFKELVLGQAHTSPRHLFMIPFLGAVIVWCGALAHDWRKKGVSREIVLWLAFGGGLLNVAASGWQNTNMDRYLAWIMPAFVVFGAEGMVWAYRRLRGRIPGAMAVMAAPLLFSAATCPVFYATFRACCEDSEHLPAFGRDLDRVLPQNVSFGVTGWCGIAYNLPGRRCAHLAGIYSPEFTARSQEGNLEILKRERETRFDYWLFAGDDKFPDGFRELQGRQIAVGPDGIDVSLAKWEAFDRALEPHPSAVNGGTRALEGMKLVARVDVGYEKDEAKYGYEVAPRYHLRPYPQQAKVLDLEGQKAFDAGKVVFGVDSMTLPLEPGRDVVFVMRTVADVKFNARSALYPRQLYHYAYSDPLELHVEIDGKEVGHVHSRISKDGFTDAVFRIPGGSIVKSPCRISLHGDHVAFCYWFYQ